MDPSSLSVFPTEMTDSVGFQVLRQEFSRRFITETMRLDPHATVQVQRKLCRIECFRDRSRSFVTDLDEPDEAFDNGGVQKAVKQQNRDGKKPASKNWKQKNQRKPPNKDNVTEAERSPNYFDADSVYLSFRSTLESHRVICTDYKRVNMTLDSLASEISYPSKSRRLNALSIPSGHVMGDMNDIRR
jgi:hypothetical protein